MANINRAAFTLFGFPIYWYGILMALAIAAGLLLCIVREKRLSLPPDTSIDLALWVVPAALVCARLYYVLFSLDQYIDNPWLIFEVRAGGMALYGSVIGGVLAGFVFTRVKRQSFARLADLVAPALALGQTIGRWGNFINQEAYGALVTNPALQRFPVSVFIEADGQWHLATFFYESAWCALIVLFLLTAERRRWFTRQGDAFLWYALLYALERAVVEGLRTDSLMLGPIRVSQALSALIVVVAGMILIIRHHTKGRPTP